uniref:Putative glucosamine-6-phosphate deaminase-like protein BT-0258 n=1 Tax=Stylophora pistillata TaxID=50429 RepID=A0A2B4RLE8_STYPI
MLQSSFDKSTVFEKRFEKINTVVFDTPLNAVREVAQHIATLIKSKQAENKPCVLGLATGATPIKLYQELVRLHKEEGLSFKNVVSFNLDEYYPMAPESTKSYVYFMKQHLFNHIDIPAENYHIPDGNLSKDEIIAYCDSYEAKIEKLGGIDLQILGIGGNGHIGFNESGALQNSKTRLVALDNITRVNASGEFGGIDNTPKTAITLGVKKIMEAKEVVLLAWSDRKARIVAQSVEGGLTARVPASYLQEHNNVSFVLDESAAANLTRFDQPWLVEKIQWNEMLIKKAVIKLALKLEKTVLALTDDDYLQNGMSDLLLSEGTAYDVNIRVFNHLQNTITGWPAGKAGEDNPKHPERAFPEQKRVIVFSPHPDDDIISMGGTFQRLQDQGHDVHVAYQTSGNIAVADAEALRFAHFVVDYNKHFGIENKAALEIFNKSTDFLKTKESGGVDTPELRAIKGLMRRGEARATAQFVGLKDDHIHHMDLPFYETGTIEKKPLGEADIQQTMDLISQVKPHQIYVAGDLADPHGTHKVCLDAVFEACKRLKKQNPEMMKDCWVWMYRGAWHEWALEEIEMAVPMSPQQVLKKRYGIFKHQSQKDGVVFQGSDAREFWQRAEDRNAKTADFYKKLGEFKLRKPFKRPDGTVWKPKEKGKQAGSWWYDIPSFATRMSAKERTGYPTQKPVALLERILKASSNEGDFILDPFCGCATTAIASEKLGRRWVGIDVSRKAYDKLQERVIIELDGKIDFGIDCKKLAKNIDVGMIHWAKSPKTTKLTKVTDKFYDGINLDKGGNLNNLENTVKDMFGYDEDNYTSEEFTKYIPFNAYASVEYKLNEKHSFSTVIHHQSALKTTSFSLGYNLHLENFGVGINQSYYGISKDFNLGASIYYGTKDNLQVYLVAENLVDIGRIDNISKLNFAIGLNIVQKNNKRINRDAIFDVETNLPSVDAVDSVSSVGVVGSVSSVDVVDSISSVDAVDKVSSADAVDKVSSADVVDKVSSADAVDKVSSVDAVDKVSSVDAVDKVSSVDAVDKVSSVDAVDKIILRFDGNATAHAKANSVNNVTITLKSAILQNGSDLSAVPSKTKNDIKISFNIFYAIRSASRGIGKEGAFVENHNGAAAEAYVIANDGTGNFSKQVVVQDATENPTDAMVLSLDTKDKEAPFEIGDRNICTVALPPKILITEVADPSNKTYARFVELQNLNPEEIVLNGWKLAKYTNGSIRKTSVDLSSVRMSSNGFAVIANRDFQELFNRAPTLMNTTISGNGDDVYALLDEDGNIHDIYGVIGEDGTGKVWDYLDGIAIRKTTVSEPKAVFDPTEWTILKKPPGVTVNIRYTPFSR